MSDNDTGSQQHQQINLEKHPIARIPTLAMIEEQSITAALTKVEEQRTKVTDIFPSQETPSEDPTSEQGNLSRGIDNSVWVQLKSVVQFR